MGSNNDNSSACISWRAPFATQCQLQNKQWQRGTHTTTPPSQGTHTHAPNKKHPAKNNDEGKSEFACPVYVSKGDGKKFRKLNFNTHFFDAHIFPLTRPQNVVIFKKNICLYVDKFGIGSRFGWLIPFGCQPQTWDLKKCEKEGGWFHRVVLLGTGRRIHGQGKESKLTSRGMFASSWIFIFISIFPGSQISLSEGVGFVTFRPGLAYHVAHWIGGDSIVIAAKSRKRFPPNWITFIFGNASDVIRFEKVWHIAFYELDIIKYFY